MGEPLIYALLHPYDPRYPDDPRDPSEIVEPDSCALCGVPQRGHGQRYHRRGEPVGFARYVSPDDATRLARMKARAAARRYTAGSA